ncbi:hypothetical protein J3B02_005008 [Coemansia erecta]|nr:hypothetical protein J3B02_005008 [Coemansia erecta]
MEYESRRLHRAQHGHAEMTEEDAAMRAGEYHRIWPHGSGLGLIALLTDEQLCGVDSRSRAAMDPALPAVRMAAQRALERDRIVRKYYAPTHFPSAISAPTSRAGSDQHRG